MCLPEEEPDGTSEGRPRRSILQVRFADNLWGWVIGVFLPFYAFHCLSTRLRRRRLFVFLNIALACAITATVVGIFASPQAASWLIGASIVMVVFMLFVFGAVARQDDAWTRIHGFQQHRRVTCTFKNGIAVCSLMSMLFQMASLASKLLLIPDPNSPSTYDQLKLKLKAALGPFLLEFDFKAFSSFRVQDVEDVIAYSPMMLASLGVLLWWILYAGVAAKILALAKLEVGSNKHTDSRLLSSKRCACFGLTCAEMLFFSQALKLPFRHIWILSF